MKCLKCGYISFDYNERCPRCNKALTLEREWTNLPAFKPNPPSLLDITLAHGSGSELDMAILAARDSKSLEKEIMLEDDMSTNKIDFELPGLSMDERFPDQETSGEKTAKHEADKITPPEEDLKLILDI